jgi:ATP-dependent DNA ligase
MMMAELVQLAGTWDFRTVQIGGMMAETKIDGFRAAYLRDWRGVPGLYTRNGQHIEGVGHIVHRLKLMEQCAGAQMFFDGEFQIEGRLSATKHWVERGWKSGEEAGTFHLFDGFPAAEWATGGTDTPLYQRKQTLADLVAAADAHPVSWEWREGTRGKEPSEPAVTLLADEWVNDAAEALSLARRVWAVGDEGLMLKDAESPYRRNRSQHWLKVKTAAYKAA